MITHTQRETIHDKLILFVELVNERHKYEQNWVKMSITNIHFSNSKFEVTFKKADSECRYIRTHSKKKQI